MTETKLQTDTEVVSVLNVFTTTPDQQDRLVELVKDGVTRTASKNDGFLSSTVLKSRDGASVVNLSQWSSFDVLPTNHEKNLTNDDYVAQMDEISKIASSDSHPYEVVFIHQAE